MQTVNFHRRRRQAGFALLEAMVAMLVMAFGMLAISGMQVSLSRNADVAKQRTEAMRLAQRKIDEYRSFTSIAAAAGHTIVWDTLPANSTDTVVTNASYAVVSTLAGTAANSMRPLRVQVTWLDRANQSQVLTLSSVLSKNDPIDMGNITNPLPLNQPLRRPMNRNINIPIPALDLGDGRSGTQFNPDYVIVYSNIDAGVVKICDPVTATSTATVSEINAAIAGTSGSCVDVTGYIVAGYIGRSATSVTWPTGMNHVGITRNTAFSGQGINCIYSDARDQNTNAIITADNGYKYYLCVVPLSAPFLWSGTMRLGGMAPTAASNFLVCRYQYTQTAITANERNVQPYSNVNLSMDEQNYQVVTNTSTLASSVIGSTSTTYCPAAMTVAGVSVGVVHQDCRATNPSRGTECPAASP